jgi:hypothetical protein
MSGLSPALSNVVTVSTLIVDNRFFMESAVSAIVVMSSNFCLAGYPYIKKEKPYIKRRHVDNRREAAWGLAKLCRQKMSTNCRQSTSVANGGFCCFFPTIGSFFAYFLVISHNCSSLGVEVGHG